MKREPGYVPGIRYGTRCIVYLSATEVYFREVNGTKWVLEPSSSKETPVRRFALGIPSIHMEAHPDVRGEANLAPTQSEQSPLAGCFPVGNKERKILCLLTTRNVSRCYFFPDRQLVMNRLPNQVVRNNLPTLHPNFDSPSYHKNQTLSRAGTVKRFNFAKISQNPLVRAGFEQMIISFTFIFEFLHNPT